MVPCGCQIHPKSTFYESFYQKTPKWVKINNNFFWTYVSGPPGCPQMAKKYDFFHFYHILMFFGRFDLLKHEKLPQTKLFLEIWPETIKIIATSPGGNTLPRHPGGSFTLFLSHDRGILTNKHHFDPLKWFKHSKKHIWYWI